MAGFSAKELRRLFGRLNDELAAGEIKVVLPRGGIGDLHRCRENFLRTLVS